MSLSSRDSTTKIKQVRTTNSGPCHAHRHDPKHDNTHLGVLLLIGTHTVQAKLNVL